MSIEEKYDEVRQLINIGKEKGYLLYDEVNELLPSEITSSDELDDLFNTFGSAGIEVIDSDQKYLRDDKPIDRTARRRRGARARPHAGRARQDQRSGPHVPARDGHRAAAHARRRSRDRPAHRARQARGHQVDLAHAAHRQEGHRSSAISCTPASAPSASWSSSTTRRSPTSASTSARKQVQKQIDAVRKARAVVREARREARRDAARARRPATSGSTAVRAGPAMRARVELSQRIREIEFTESVKRRLIDEMKDAVEGVQAVQREIEGDRSPAQSEEQEAEAEGRRQEEPPAADQGAEGSSSRR